MDKRHQDIINQLNYLHPENQVVELRIKGVKNPKSDHWQGFAGGKAMLSGYFNNYEKIADLACAIDDETKPDATYILLNQCSNDLYARSADCLVASAQATSDRDIVRYKNLLIDIDPVRKSGISSTDQELQYAITTATVIKDDLSLQGWPEPLVGNSGNGAHLIYKIEFASVPENIDMIKKFLHCLAQKYNDEKINIDTSVYNPARITKLYGTLARKGSNTVDRPHRCSEIISIPDTPQTVSADLLKQIIESTTGLQTTERTQDNTDDNIQGFDIKKYLEAYGFTVIKTAKHGNSTLYGLEECIFDSSHKGNEAAIGQKDSGELFYHCFHNSCKGKTWRDARNLISGDDKLTPYTKNITFNPHLVSLKPKNHNKTFSAVELANPDIKPPSYIVDNLITQGLTLLVGKPKKGKSFMALNIALSIVNGEKVFGCLDVQQGAVLYLALEDSEARLKHRIITQQGHNKFPANLRYAINWDRIDQEGLEKIAEEIKRVENLKLVIIDTLAKIRPAKSGKDVYQADYITINHLKQVADLCETPFLVLHHQRKSPSDDVFDTVSGSLGITGAADTIIILDRKNNTNDAELIITGRDIVENNLAMNFNDYNCSWVITGEASTVKLNKAEEKIVQLIEGNGSSMQSREIVLLLVNQGEHESTVRWRLSEMVKKGILYRDDVGVYKTNTNNTNKPNNTNNSNIPNTSNSQINGFIGSIGIIGKNIKEEKTSSSTLYINDSTSAFANVETMSEIEPKKEQACNSCEHLNFDSSCSQKIQGINEMSCANGCSLYQKKSCDDCNSGFPEYYCNMVDDEVPAHAIVKWIL